MARASAAPTPCTLGPKAIVSTAGSRGFSEPALSWNTIWTCLRNSFAGIPWGDPTSLPSNSMEPLSGSISPMSRRPVVDLPQSALPHDG